MKHATLALIAALLVAGCTDERGATEALTDAGYKDIHITGYSWSGCGKDDDYATAFIAVSPGGFRISGAVCAGWLFKGSTIRTFGRIT